MAAYDLQEQEQISEIKAWWEQYGQQLMALATAALLAVSGWQGWQWYSSRNAGEAAALYGSLLQAGGAGDAQKVREAAGQLIQQYGSTPYAYLAALASGKVQATQGDLKNAAAQLNWVVANPPGPAVRDIARLRLAAVQFDAGEHANALGTLAADPVAELAPAFAELRGDILAADGKLEEARAAYAKALAVEAGGTGGGQLTDLLRAKLEALGGAR